MENEENLSELRKKIISTIDLLQEILDIADEDDNDIMTDDLIGDLVKSDSIACGDLH